MTSRVSGRNVRNLSVCSMMTLGLCLSTHVLAQTTPVTTPSNVASSAAPVPAPVIAQTPETLSARTLVRLEQLTRELSGVIGRLEALEGANMAQKAEIERLATLMDLSRANQGTPPSADTRNEAASEPAMVANVASSSAEAAFTAPMPPPITPDVMLINAQTALQSGNYPVAEANLTQLIWVHPTSAQASEGRWLLGETRFIQSSWGPAAQAYVDYLKAAPQGPRGAEALLRLAGAFRQLGDARQRCLALSEFKRRAPRPDATLKARADGEIARMACPPV